MFVVHSKNADATWLPIGLFFVAIALFALALLATIGNSPVTVITPAVVGLIYTIWGVAACFRIEVKGDSVIRRSVFGTQTLSAAGCCVGVAPCSSRQGGHYKVEIIAGTGERIPVLKLIGFGWKGPIRQAEKLATSLDLPFHLDPAIEKGRQMESESWRKARFLLIIPLAAAGFGAWAVFEEYNYQGVEIICRPSRRISIDEKQWSRVGNMRIQLDFGPYTIKTFDDETGKWQTHTIQVKEKETAVFRCPSKTPME